MELFDPSLIQPQDNLGSKITIRGEEYFITQNDLMEITQMDNEGWYIYPQINRKVDKKLDKLSIKKWQVLRSNGKSVVLYCISKSNLDKIMTSL